MYKILKKKVLNSQVKLMVIDAKEVAKKAQPGQFIILRINEDGERIPLTISDYDREQGTITIVFQEVGKTTKLLGTLNEGDCLLDFVGPLGVPSHFDNIKKVAVIGGGLGTAIAYPQAKKLFNEGVEVHSIVGFREKDLIILEDEMNKVSTKLFVMTDDGSNGNKGFVTDMLKSLIEDGNKYDLVIAIGPLIMMKFVSKLTKEYNIKTVVSMNPVMIDGTGMCGGCRLTVGGETKFACVDGPDFDGHLVDFDEAMRRQLMYKDYEKVSDEKHACRLMNLSEGSADNA
jgi:ferredoxin--NADP+ reductase